MCSLQRPSSSLTPERSGPMIRPDALRRVSAHRWPRRDGGLPAQAPRGCLVLLLLPVLASAQWRRHPRSTRPSGIFAACDYMASYEAQAKRAHETPHRRAHHVALAVMLTSGSTLAAEKTWQRPPGWECNVPAGYIRLQRGHIGTARMNPDHHGPSTTRIRHWACVTGGTVYSGTSSPRVFTVNYLVKPQAVTTVFLSTGLYVERPDRRSKDDWWNLTATRAEFIR